MSIELSAGEVELCQKDPAILRILADIHSVYASESEDAGHDCSCVLHMNRRDKLREEADRIEDEY